MLLACALGPEIATAAAQDKAEVDARLEAVTAQIEALERQLASRRREQDALGSELADIETELGAIARRQRATRGELAAAEARLAELEAEHGRLERELDSSREQLAAQLRSAYAMGRQGYLKMLLNQEDPALLGRVMAYYDYFNRARLAQIGAVIEQLRQVAAVREEIDRTRANLVRINADLDAQAQRHQEHRRERQQILASINARIARGEQSLDEAQAEQDRLEALLKELQAAFADIPTTLDARPFDARRGQLAWPVDGPFVLGPGQAKSGGMHRAGALIGAPAGSEVRAVSRGRVAYADWLRGFGLLTILDHGDGYMSLYAFNESLFKDIGDWVESGELLAVVGDSGGRTEPGLYFELRKDGRPIDLAGWFASPRP
ncbi:MAG: peptidoglycan DD-metalloendopeptidase family protein [Xanthomonadales bacterium]|nr:peptidoglycan DD-metalloendopeptidase family protein [Xanthomonadales bacterium]